MAAYIFGERNGIHIIDLQKTVKKLKEAYQYVKELSAAGESIIIGSAPRNRPRTPSRKRRNAAACIT